MELVHTNKRDKTNRRSRWILRALNNMTCVENVWLNKLRLQGEEKRETYINQTINWKGKLATFWLTTSDVSYEQINRLCYLRDVRWVYLVNKFPFGSVNNNENTKGLHTYDSFDLIEKEVIISRHIHIMSLNSLFLLIDLEWKEEGNSVVRSQIKICFVCLNKWYQTREKPFVFK